MKRTLIIFLSALFIITNASEYKHSDAMRTMLNYLYSSNYDSALSVSDSIMNINQVAGEYMKMSILGTYMSDFETDTLENEFYNLYEAIIKNRNSDDAMIMFFVGGAYFQKSSYLAMKRNYTGALQHGLKASSYFNKTLDKDSTLYDAYLSNGIIDYFKGKFLMGFGKNTAGKNEIKLAAERGLFTKYPAYDMLAIIYSMEEQYDTALIYSDILLKAFPSNRMFLFTRIKILLDAEDYESALQYLNILENNIMQYQEMTYYNIAYVRYNKALCFKELNMNTQSMEYIEKVLSMEKYISIDGRLKDFINKANELKKKIS